MSKLLAIMLAATATTAFAADTTYTVAQAQAELAKAHCIDAEVWQQPGGCFRGQSDCTSLITKDGAQAVLNDYKNDDVKVVFINTGKMCSVLILDKSYKWNTN
jgi:hypothetical protein